MTITIKIIKKPAPENGTTPSKGNIDQLSNSVVLNPNSRFDAANNNLHKYEKVQPQPKKSAGASDSLPEPPDDVVLDDHGLPIERSALNCNTQPEDSNCEQSELRELPGIVDEECLDDDDSDPSENERREIELTEDFVADAFVDTFWDRIRYDHTSGRWYFWNGRYWERDQTNSVFDLARRHCRELRGKDKSMSSKEGSRRHGNHGASGSTGRGDL